VTVERLGGKFTNTINRHLDYLIVGTEGNPCWTYSCYGRKIEDALDLKRQGAGLLIVHEEVFHAAVLQGGPPAPERDDERQLSFLFGDTGQNQP